MNFDYCLDRFIDLEKQASILYEKIENISQDEIKLVAKQFKEEEIKHTKYLSELKGKYNNINVNHQIVECIDSSPSIIRNIEGFSRKDFFILALSDEKKSIMIYEKIKNLFEENSEGFNLFSKLVAEERKHMLYVLKEIQK